MKVTLCNEKTELLEGQKCFTKKEREKYVKEKGRIKIFPFFNQIYIDPENPQTKEVVKIPY